MSQKSFSSLLRTSVADQPLLLCLVLALCCVAWAQPDKNEPGKASLTGRYQGSAKNKAEEVIAVTLDLTEKDGALSGMINSSHGDFPITGGTHKGEEVTIEFDAGGPGTISLRLTEDRLVGTWTAGEDGGSMDVKRVVKQGEAPKGKS